MKRKKKGMVGIKFCILPESVKASKNYELMAKAFCLLDEMDRDETLMRTTQEVL